MLTSLDIVNLDKYCSPYLVAGIKLGSQSQARNQRQLAGLQHSSPQSKFKNMTSIVRVT